MNFTDPLFWINALMWSWFFIWLPMSWRSHIREMKRLLVVRRGFRFQNRYEAIRSMK
ncbi:hypothetical protein EDF84_1064 [Erwinia rhapontici]|nr:hypothetical protein EDF84_1064 [Erwinia rhapontici]